jgi:hypothetical protein
MDFVDWCTKVLHSMIAARQESAQVRSFGMLAHELGTRLFGEGMVDPLAYAMASHATAPSRALLSALYDLRSIGLVEQEELTHNWKVSELGRGLGEDLTPVWQQICTRPLEPDCEELLRAVNLLSHREGDQFALLDTVDGKRLLAELGWDSDRQHLWATISDLRTLRLVSGNIFLGGQIEVAATYQGLVWETRRGLTIESQFIDGLVAEWETTSVELKREVRTNTKDEKAEFIKDVLGLANTQASGRRWLIVGFDDKTRSYQMPPDSKLTQNHLEQLVNAHIKPNLQIRYEVADYRRGPVGKLEVLRDPAQLPYKVAKALKGEKKHIEVGQVFVRHGSQVEPPTDAELRALEEEGARARTAA